MRNIRAWLAAAAFGLLLAAGFMAAAPASAIKDERPSHMDSFVNPSGCVACHAGRGVSGTPLLQAKPMELCMKCHGASKSSGRAARKDIQSTLENTSRHPIIETGQYHFHSEPLPSTRSDDPRHVSCFDCHRTHLTSQANPSKGIQGYRPGRVRQKMTGIDPMGMKMPRIESDFELCYLCHADSANLPADRRNIALEFDPANASFHPVEAIGRNRTVQSLIEGLTTNDMIGCGACHGNGDPNGPRGPHGSEFAPILVARYNYQDGPETTYTYELCYKCHERNSILGDASFKRHQFHIGFKGIACARCHSAHGSKSDRYLIRFESQYVGPANSGGPLYIPGAAGMPKCMLTCHQVKHDTTGITPQGGTERPWPW